MGPDRAGGAKRFFFITTVPKAGKNVLRSFLNCLGIEQLHRTRPDLSPGEAVSALDGMRFGGLNRATYASPGASHRTEEWCQKSFDAFLEALTRHRAEPGWICHHFIFNERLNVTLQQQGIPVVFLYRDPRDILVSMANYYLHKGKPAYLEPGLKGLKAESIMKTLLEGTDTLVAFSDYLAAFDAWRSAGGVLTLRFEDLIGLLGGGDNHKQTERFRVLIKHMNWPMAEEAFGRCVLKAFNEESSTFFRARIGSWPEAFTPEITRLFMERIGPLAERWGYVDERERKNDVALL